MNKVGLSFFIHFFILCALHLVAMFFQIDWLGTNTKPLLLISLMYSVLTFSKTFNGDKRFIKLLMIALGFSWAGDTLLLVEKKIASPIFFYFGLGAFLIAHIYYILLYKKLGHQKQSLPLLLFYIIYLIYFLYLLLPGMELNLAIPVVLYAFILSAMAWSAWRIVSANKLFGLYVVLGAALFVISDSILAIRKFRMPITQGDFLIMVTYLAAQFLITWGILNTLNQSSVKTA